MVKQKPDNFKLKTLIMLQICFIVQTIYNFENKAHRKLVKPL